jgi:hypothetical protein
MSFAERVDLILINQGEDIVYSRRLTTGRNLNDLSKSVAITDYSIKAHFRTSQERPISGQLAEDVKQVRIAAKALPIIPKRGDMVAKATGEMFEVLKVDTRYGSGEVLIHILNVQGG